ncbi:MAG: hypothetical protein U9Q08_02890 [Candidatus Omnitrophota bacterium]|nr:hypothetical protein [Candidatus Omnitrophota bacterium]
MRQPSGKVNTPAARWPLVWGVVGPGLLRSLDSPVKPGNDA